jgi:hypothetical protein
MILREILSKYRPWSKKHPSGQAASKTGEAASTGNRSGSLFSTKVTLDGRIQVPGVYKKSCLSGLAVIYLTRIQDLRYHKDKMLGITDYLAKPK